MRRATDLSRHRLSWRGYGCLILLALALYAPAVWSGRPLSVHEGRLPQLAREMVWNGGDWLLPTSGGRPWLERPPLPHWMTALSMMLLGRVGSLWSARLPAAAAGAAIGCIAAWISARWFGRAAGLLSGIVAVSTYEIYQYATLAEDDIYLGLLAVGCMAMFVRQQWPRGDEPADMSLPSWPRTIVGGRPWPTVVFFLLLGLTNLAKGPLVGAMPIVATVGLFIIWNRDARSARHYAWLWGWIIFVVLTIAWPLWAVWHYPDVVENWRFDYLGQVDGVPALAAHQWDHPWWYYLWMLPLATAPWGWATVIGLGATAGQAVRRRCSPQRLLWCWAAGGLLLLSFPMRKHHQYLVPIMAPWAILGALGLLKFGNWLVHAFPSRAILRQKGVTIVVSAILCVTIVISACIQLFVAGRDPHTLAELKLLDYARYHVPPGEPVLINADVDSLEFFRLQYGLRHDQKLIQNLSYLRDPALARPLQYVLTRGSDEPYLQTLGSVRRLAEATSAARDESPGHNFVLFELTPRANLPREPPPPYISVMQAMGRKHGPWIGEELK